MREIDMHTDTLLRRREAADALTAAGYPVAPATLATMASRGGGPPHRVFGRIPLDRWGDLLAWAEGRCTAPRASTAEADAAASMNPRPHNVAGTRSR
jgi:hypothetical protein